MFFSLTDEQMEMMLVASLLPVVQTTGGCRPLGIRTFKSPSYHTSANHHPLFIQRGGAAGIRVYRDTLEDTEQETHTYTQVEEKPPASFPSAHLLERRTSETC